MFKRLSSVVITLPWHPSWGVWDIPPTSCLLDEWLLSYSRLARKRLILIYSQLLLGLKLNTIYYTTPHSSLFLYLLIHYITAFIFTSPSPGEKKYYLLHNYNVRCICMCKLKLDLLLSYETKQRVNMLHYLYLVCSQFCTCIPLWDMSVWYNARCNSNYITTKQHKLPSADEYKTININ